MNHLETSAILGLNFACRANLKPSGIFKVSVESFECAAMIESHNREREMLRRARNSLCTVEIWKMFVAYQILPFCNSVWTSLDLSRSASGKPGLFLQTLTIKISNTSFANYIHPKLFQQHTHLVSLQSLAKRVLLLVSCQSVTQRVLRVVKLRLSSR